MITKPITEAQVRRGGDRSHPRQPLRLEIARRRKRSSAGGEKFVTEVRFGDAAALFVPWSDERRGAPEVVLDPVADLPVEAALA
jgi:hypothetical protein